MDVKDGKLIEPAPGESGEVPFPFPAEELGSLIELLERIVSPIDEARVRFSALAVRIRGVLAGKTLQAFSVLQQDADKVSKCYPSKSDIKLAQSPKSRTETPASSMRV